MKNDKNTRGSMFDGKENGDRYSRLSSKHLCSIDTKSRKSYFSYHTNIEHLTRFVDI